MMTPDRARHPLAAAALSALAAVACEATHVTPCPGRPVATLHFRGDPAPGDGGACSFGADAAVAFTATLSVVGGVTAFLCPDRSEAEPLRGSTDGGHVSVSSSRAAANVPSCACAVQVSESVDGDLVPGDGGVAAFTGAMLDRVEATGAGACEPDGGADAAAVCGVPCDLRWELTGTR